MKRILIVALLSMAVLAFAAPGNGTGNQPLEIYRWEGAASMFWNSFEIYYHPGTGAMWGTWWYGEEDSGWIEGHGEYDPTAKRHVLGEGSFGGDNEGYWEGIFILNGTCWGSVWNDDGIGSFNCSHCE